MRNVPDADDAAITSRLGAIVNPPTSVQGRAYRFFMPAQIMYAMGVPGYTLHLLLALWLGSTTLALASITGAVVMAACFASNRLGRHDEAFGAAIAIIAVHSLVGVRALGWESGYQYYLFTIIVFLFFQPTWPVRLRLPLAALLTGLFLGLYLPWLRLGPVLEAGPGATSAIYVLNCLVAVTAFGAIGYWYDRAADRAECRLARLVRTDPLTGLPNRRGLEGRLGVEVSRSSRTGESICLVMADIDHFKRVNDTWGHETGDEVLQAVAGAMRDSLREQDMVGRFGGEEFLVILPDTDVAGGEQVAEKMRRVVHELEFSAAGSFFGVTMTFGVSELDPEDRPDQAIRRADEALYAGKQAGRDRVMVWDQIAKET